MELIEKTYITKHVKKIDNIVANATYEDTSYLTDKICSQCDLFALCFSTDQEQTQYANQAACIGFTQSDVY